jgi:hypothetical protein
VAWTLWKDIEYAADAIPDSNLTDFPVPVWITTDADIAAEIGGGGGIKFTSADGSADLDFGLYPTSNLAAGTVHARVKISPLTAASIGQVAMRLYYSSSESTTEDKAGTVSNDYALFMPLEEDPSGSAPQMYDWVSESNLGTSSGSMTSGDLVAGIVGNGLDFDGTGDEIDISGMTSLDNSECTIEAIVNKPFSGDDCVFGCGANKLGFNITSGGNLQISQQGSGVLQTSTGGISASTWAHVALVYTRTGTTVYFYADGALLSSHTESTNLGTSTTAEIAVERDTVRQYAGIIDEVRASNAIRDADWIAYSYTTDFNAADLWTYSAEQGGGGGGGLSIPIAMYHYRHRIGA